MEPRVLYAADFAPAAFMASAASDTSHQRLIDTTAPPQQATPVTEIVFVDARVPDQATLLADLKAQAKAGRPIEIVLIDANEDGIARITQTLADRNGVSAVHVISHGDSGSVQLGNTVLDEHTLATRANDVAAWGLALTQDADLLIYGCDVGAQAQGQALVQGLAALTGADVAASDDLTGARGQGGDWQLEVQSGHIEALLAPSAQAQTLFEGVLAAAVPTGKAQVVWANAGSGVAQLSVFDGATSSTATATANTGQWTLVSSASSPKRDEVIAVGVDTNGTITGEVIQGRTSTLIPLTLGSGTPTNRQGFGVAYEQTSGDAMLVWNDGTQLNYSVYNGSTWTTTTTIPGYTGAAPQHMQLVSQPGGDGMALIISDANADDHAMIWDGNGWGQAITLDTSGTSAADQTSIAVAFEAQSGHALVAYAKAADANVYFRVFDGSVWGTEAAAGNYLEAATPQWLTLASDPTSNRIAMGLISSSATDTFTSFSVWNEGGSQAWGNRTAVATQSTTTSAPTVAVAYESKTGDLLAVYGSTSANTVNYQTLGSSGVWSTTLTGPNAGGVVGALRLNSDPTTNNIMLGMQTTGGRLSFSDWSGSAWQSTPVVASNNTGSSLTPAFSWTFQDHIAGNTTNTLWLGANQANPGGWDGVNATTSTEVLALENPDVHYGSGSNTDGTFSHVFDLSAFGASGLDDIAWVSRDVALSSSLTVHRGDVLFSVPATTTLTSVNSLSVTRSDIVLFKPTVVGDYSSGTFTKVFTVNTSLLGGLGLGSGASVRGLALVELPITIGSLNSTAVSAGTFLFSYGNGNTSANDVLRYKIGDLTATKLIEGDDINLDSSITGLEVINSTTTMGNATLYTGALLVSLAQTDTQVANNYASVAASDVIYLSIIRPTGANTAIATATTVVQGSSVGISSGHIDSLALTLDAAPIIDSNGGGATANITVNENTTPVTTVMAHDIDAYADLSYSITGGADAARFTIDSQTGALHFVNAPDYENPQDSDKNNSYVVTVSASDGTLRDSQTLTVTVRNVNEAPVIISGGGGDTANLVVLDNNLVAATVNATDQDVPDTLVYTISGGLDSSLFTIDSSTGELRFSPAVSYQSPQDSDQNNVYQVAVRVIDASGAWDEQTLNIAVEASNFAPVISSDGGPANATLVINEFHTAVTTVQATDDQTASSQLTYGIAGGADRGLFSIDAQTGELRFTAPPDTQAPGDAGGVNRYEVQVSASDGQLTSYQTLTINVQPYARPVNNLPASLSATEDTPSAVTGLSVTDPDAGSAPITVTLQVQQGHLSVRNDVASGLDSSSIQYDAEHRTVTLTGSVNAINTTLADAAGVVYLSDPDHAGQDTLTMTTIDGVNTGTAPPLTDSDSRTINVAAVNDAPMAVIGQSAYTATEQTDLDLHNTGLRIADVDANTGNVQVRLTAQDGLLTVDPGSTGVAVTNSGTHSVILAGSIDQINALLDGLNGGTLVYRAPSDTPSATDTLTLVINDLGNTGSGGNLSDQSSVTVTIIAVNDAPEAVDDSTSVSEGAVLNGSSVLANDTDAEADPLSATLVQNVLHGALVFNSDGSYTYTPTAHFNGTDSFTYQASDGSLNSNIATVTITITAINDAPEAVDDSASVNEGAVLNGTTVLANDTDIDSSTLSATLVQGPAHGSLVLNANGSYTYTPTTHFNGTDSFTYQASDGTLISNVATVTITIAAVNDAPVITTNSLTINQGGTAEPLLVVTDVDNTNADLLISASDIVGGYFAHAGTGATLTQFTMADVAAHQVVFVHDGSLQAPSYTLSATDGQASTTAPPVQTSFTLTPPAPAPAPAPAPPSPPVIAAPSPAPPPAPALPTDGKNDHIEEPVTPGSGAATGAASAPATATAPGRSFFMDTNNLAPSNDGIVVRPQANPYGVDLNNRAITASNVAATSEDAFRYAWLKALNTTLSDTQNLRNSLDALREQLQNDGDGRRHLVASSIAVSTGLSVGYVIWLVRGGALIGSMLSAMPAWQMIDPLPVLSRGRGGRQADAGDDDDASIEHIFDDDDGAATPAPPPPPPPPLEEAAP